jgi:predicted Fe-S protein YdhL (DUF1289 family)
MKFSPCTGLCTSDGNFCQGCGRSRQEINESKALIKEVIAHLMKYEYDDPENFLEVLNQKSLAQFAKQQSRKYR